MKLLFFDLETTGLPISWKEKYTNKSNWPYIVQLAYIISFQNNELTQERDFILKPEGFEIPLNAIKIHGISNAKAMEIGMSRNFILKAFASEIKNSDYIIAHNAEFDINVLRCEFLRNNIEDPFNEDVKIICTMKQSKNFCKLPSAYGDYKWPSLQELYSKLFGEYFNESHNAKVDVKATFECFWKLNQLDIIKIRKEVSNQRTSYDEKFLLSFFKKRNSIFYYLISRYYPFDNNLLKLLETNLNYSALSYNTEIAWTIEFINKHKDKWEFCVSNNDWKPKKWNGLSSNISLPWSINLIRMFQENWAFEDISDYNAGALSGNKALPWCDDLLFEFQDRWNWNELSSSGILPWKEISLEKFIDKWNWKFLSNNPALPWSIDLIVKYQELWDWKSFNKMIVKGMINLTVKEVMKAYFEDKIGIEYMVFLPLNKKFLDLADDSNKFRWELLLGRGILPWSPKLIKKYLPDMVLSFSANHSIDWNINLLHQMENDIDWSHFSHHQNFNWCKDFFIIFEHKINFNQNIYDRSKINWEYLKKNKTVLWTDFLLNRYYIYLKDDCTFWEDLSWNKYIVQWTPKIIERFKEHWDWNGLSRNTSLCWSDELIRKYSKKWCWTSLSENSAINWSNQSLEEYINRLNSCDIDFTDLDDFYSTSRPTLLINRLLEKHSNPQFICNFLIANPDIFMYPDDKVWDYSKAQLNRDFIIEIHNAIKNENSR